jgi:hypothetical protein
MSKAKTGIGSYKAENDNAISPDDTDAKVGQKAWDKRDREKPDEEKIERDLEKYSEEMAEDAPGTGTPEDNP